jgi:flagellin
MASDVTLSSSSRQNLLSLQLTDRRIDRTNIRLSTGKKVASAIDDAVAFFQSKALSDRAQDLSTRRDAIDQVVSSVQTALSGMSTVESIVVQMRGLIMSAKSASDSERASLGTQLITLCQQIDHAANDTSYQGLNLINSTMANIRIQFSEKTASVLQIDGTDLRMSASKIFCVIGQPSAFVGTNAISVIGGATFVGFSEVSSAISVFDGYLNLFDSGLIRLRTSVKSMGANVALLMVRIEFTKDYVNTMKTGGDKLVLADLNEEGANLVSLQTRQQLGIQALSFANRTEQGILSLFR